MLYSSVTKFKVSSSADQVRIILELCCMVSEIKIIQMEMVTLIFEVHILLRVCNLMWFYRQHNIFYFKYCTTRFNHKGSASGATIYVYNYYILTFTFTFMYKYCLSNYSFGL
jgi:hypothetical protein